MPHVKQNRILEFWFGTEILANEAQVQERTSLWFKKSATLDAQIRDVFEALLIEAAAGAYDDWPKTKNGALALIVLCDQFSRNIHRDKEQAFAQDARALRASEIAIDRGFDLALAPLERLFVYLPFEHSEDLAHQRRSVELFDGLMKSPVTDAEKKFLESSFDFALRHRDVIERFGRFPHRNVALGRMTTRAEQEFLKRPGSRF